MQQLRGLAPLDLDFTDPVTQLVRMRTVIAGSNGTGKTTVLDAIYALIESVVNARAAAWLRTGSAQAGIILTDLPVELGEVVRIDSEEHKRAVEPLVHAIRQAESGERGFANCVYFPSEGRSLQPKRTGEVVAEQADYQWTYRFADSGKWRGSLESFLVAMDYRDLMAQRIGNNEEGEFQQFVTRINRLWGGKRVVGVDQNSFRVLVSVGNGKPISIDELSSGEKQVLLMLGEIQRRLRPGGILLIDEPEIHLHPRWQRLFIRGLTELCAELNAQMILTTHSEEVANAVFQHELVMLDTVFGKELEA